MKKESNMFLEAFFSELKGGKIKYCILRNADEVEKGDAHDVDITVDSRKLAEAEKMLLKKAKETGWKLHIRVGDIKDDMNIKCYHFYKLVDDDISIVHFDVFPTFNWKRYILLDNKTLLDGIIDISLYHRSAPIPEAVTKLFIRLLHNNYIKTKYKESIQRVFEAEDVKPCLLLFLDEKTADKLIREVKAGEWREIEEQRDWIVESIKKNAVQSWFKEKKYLVHKAKQRPGLMVVFEGTDGSGKTTIIDALPALLSNSFPEGMMDYYHWRPGVIKSEKKGEHVAITDPHAKKPYNKAKSFAKFMFFNLDYIIGYWIKVRIQLSKGHLVIFDRYYYDYYLDKIRYRLDISDWVLSFWGHLIPKPDITLLLIGDAQVLYERKKEITVKEIQEQVDRLKENKRHFNNAEIIDVNQPINKVVKDAAYAILEACSKRIGDAT